MAESGRKQYLWLPYLSKVVVKPKTVFFGYKGGEIDILWTKVHSIMLYGQSVELPQSFFEKCAFYKIPIVIHRRHMPRAVFVCPTLPPDRENLLTQQLLFRTNKKKQAHISKRLLQAKFKSMNWLTSVNKDLLYRVVDLQRMSNIESWHAKRYWEIFYRKLNAEGTRRGRDNEIKSALDAVSKFVSGIILRWILYHGLSPYHGFLHKPTDYPALVYDLMEPYRGYFDKVVFEAAKEVRVGEAEIKVEGSKLIGASIEKVKELGDERVYVEATRQVVTFHELLHGVVLALRSYLLGNCKRFVVPLPSKPNGGRPINAGYKLYGHHAGKTDFWPQSKIIARDFEERMQI